MNCLTFPSFVSVTLILILCCFSVGSLDPFDITTQHIGWAQEPLKISRRPKSLFSNLGNVPGTRQCDGTGQFLQWRIEGCTYNYFGGLCTLPANQFFRFEFSFIPSKSAESLGLRAILLDPFAGRRQLIACERSNISIDPIQAGKEYAVTGTIAPALKLQGKVLTLQLQVFDKSDKQIVACAEADYVIV